MAHVYVIVMRPPDGEPQFMENGRPVLRSLTIGAESEDGAREAAEQQAHDIAVQYEELPFVIESVRVG